MIVVPVPTINYKSTITRFYKQDPVFIEKYHSQRENGFQTCVDSCAQGFEDYNESDAEMYIVQESGNEIGFFTLIKDVAVNGYVLYQFFMVPMYRTKSFRKEMMGLVKSKVGIYALFAAVYEKNEPVMRFYSKIGSKMFEAKAKSVNVVIFELKEGERLWHSQQ